MLKAPSQGSPPQHLGLPCSGTRTGLGPALCSQCPHPAVCPAGKVESEPKNRFAPRAVKSPGQSTGETGQAPGSWSLGQASGWRFLLAHTPPLPSPCWLRPQHQLTHPSLQDQEAGRVLGRFCAAIGPLTPGGTPDGKLRLAEAACQARQVWAGGVHLRGALWFWKWVSAAGTFVPPHSGEGLPGSFSGCWDSGAPGHACRSHHWGLLHPQPRLWQTHPRGPPSSEARAVCHPLRGKERHPTPSPLGGPWRGDLPRVRFPFRG